jgi:hypothetical protein
MRIEIMHQLGQDAAMTRLIDLAATELKGRIPFTGNTGLTVNNIGPDLVMLGLDGELHAKVKVTSTSVVVDFDDLKGFLRTAALRLALPVIKRKLEVALA